MEPPTPSNWSPSATTLRAIVLAALVAASLFTLPVLAQDDTDAEGSFDTTGEEIVLERAEVAVVSGTTTLDEGTMVTVRIRSTAGESPFLKSKQVPVDDDGDFIAWFDTRDVGDEDSVIHFQASLRSEDGDELATADGAVVGQHADYTPETTTTTTTTTTTKTTTTPTTTTTTDDSAEAPGFGVLAALLGLLGAAFAARRY